MPLIYVTFDSLNFISKMVISDACTKTVAVAKEGRKVYDLVKYRDRIERM